MLLSKRNFHPGNRATCIRSGEGQLLYKWWGSARGVAIVRLSMCVTHGVNHISVPPQMGSPESFYCWLGCIQIIQEQSIVVIAVITPLKLPSSLPTRPEMPNPHHTKYCAKKLNRTIALTPLPPIPFPKYPAKTIHGCIMKMYPSSLRYNLCCSHPVPTHRSQIPNPNLPHNN